MSHIEIAHISSSNIEIPNDISGTIYIDKGEMKGGTIRKLLHAGFDIDLEKAIS